MDLITQGVIGSAFAQSVSKKKKMRLATFAGFLGGLAPDADAFIRSSEDALLSIEYHRHFTHSLAFIPFGALVPALITWLITRRKFSFKTIYIFSVIGYATHGLLDACTSYGTRLLWPFSNERIAWDNIAIIDLFFTLPLLLAMIFTLKTRKNTVVKAAIAFCMAYLCLGIFQRDRAIEHTESIALQRGHTNISVQAKPTFGQLVLWKTIYKYENRFYVDAIRLGVTPFFDTVFYEGEHAIAADIDQEFSNLDKNSILYKDILRFKEFSADMLIYPNENKNIIGDARYSLLPTSIRPLWGIEVNTEEPNKHAPFLTFRDMEKRSWDTFFSMIKGKHP